MTELEVNGVLINDAPGFVQVNAATVQEVTVQEDTGGEVFVWTSYSAVPRPITNLSATDNIAEHILVTWTVPPNEGNPTDTLSVDLYIDGGLHLVGATSPFTHDVQNAEHEYYVLQHGAEGTTQSNSDTGSSPWGGSTSPFFITTNRTITAGVDVPANTQLTVCMCGGGGSGSGIQSPADNLSGGGHAGGIVSTTVTMTAGETAVCVIGVGGLGVDNPGDGRPGTQTTFGPLTAGGGREGYSGYYHPVEEDITYRGNGGSRTTCGGTFYDGIQDHHVGANGVYYAWGGEAGAFGDGGRGVYYNPGGAGGVGAGGGGTTRTVGGGERTGAGGRGQIRLSWETYSNKTI